MLTARIEKNPSQEDEISDQISAGKPDRLLQKAEHPLAAQLTDPLRRARHVAGLKVQEGADAEQEASAGIRAMLADPELLQGIAHADQEAIRVRFADVAAGLFDVLRAGEEPVAVPGDRVPRKCLGQCLGSARRRGVGAADR